MLAEKQRLEYRVTSPNWVSKASTSWMHASSSAGFSWVIFPRYLFSNASAAAVAWFIIWLSLGSVIAGQISVKFQVISGVVKTCASLGLWRLGYFFVLFLLRGI